MNEKKKLVYKAPEAVDRQAFERTKAVGSIHDIEAALVGYVQSENSLSDAFEIVAGYLVSPSPALRGTAVLCLGHLARIHRSLPFDPTVAAILCGLKDADQYVRGQAHNALDDIEQFVPSLGRAIAKGRGNDPVA